jgi:hypothetical protein
MSKIIVHAAVTYLHLAVGQTFPGTGFLLEHSMKKTFCLNILVSTSTDTDSDNDEGFRNKILQRTQHVVFIISYTNKLIPESVLPIAR